MPIRSFGPVAACALVLILPASASAYYEHVVAPGETLTSVAATDGLSVAALAAANGLSPGAYLIAGTQLAIPPQGEPVVATPVSVSPASTAPATEVAAGSGGYLVAPGDTLTGVAARSGVSVAALAAANGLSTTAFLIAGARLTIPAPGQSVSPRPTAGMATPVATGDSGGYVVQPGDTLSAIAARDGTTVAEVAAVNGLDPNGILLAGATLRLPGAGSGTEYVSTSSPSASAEGQPVGAPAQGTAGAPPYPTPERVSASEIAGIASANGVPPALAQAIGWQESGWNNDLTSVDGAVGVMQVLPGTWDWINRTLTAGTPLAPASATDNVRGGVLLLHALLNSTGSDALAAAGYYQGLSSVQQNGMYSDTQQYVNSVMALEHQFGGGG